MQPNQSVPYKRIAASAVSIALEDRQCTPCQQQQAIIGTNAKVEVQQTLAAAKPITAVTLANPGVASCTANGYANGDIVLITVTAGMVQVDQQAVRVSAVSTDSFAFEGLDTTLFTDWVSGSCQKVTAFQVLSSAQSVTMPNPAPAKIDITTLIDISKQYAYGLPDAPAGSITGLFNPGGVAEGLIMAATTINGTLVIRLSFSGNTKHSIFNANVSGGQGFNLAANAAATTTVEFTPIKQVLHYAT